MIETKVRRVWIADDGKEFTNEDMAINHQRRLQVEGVVRDLAGSNSEHIVGAIIARFNLLTQAMSVKVPADEDTSKNETLPGQFNNQTPAVARERPVKKSEALKPGECYPNETEPEYSVESDGEAQDAQD